MGLLTGTILANTILRWMGCQIGRRTIVVAPLQCFDWNAVNFGNDCVIDGHPQFHTFENMMLKVKRTQIQDGCAIGVGSTVMGGAVIERDTTILPLSLVLKEMNLTPATYGGSPAEIVSDTNLSAAIPDATHSTSKPHVVDNTDWLKAAAIILVLIDHFGYFFMENDEWWGVLGRFAAPIFFFPCWLLKVSVHPTTLDRSWCGLTLLDSANADWEWVAPNILLSFVLIRFAYRYVSKLVERYPWISVAFLVAVLIAILPIAAQLVDYGAEGWLWALFGLLHRQYVDSRTAVKVGGVDPTDTANEETDLPSTALVGLRGGCGCLRLAGTIGIRVSLRLNSSSSFWECCVMSVSLGLFAARAQSLPASRKDRRRVALHWSTHTGNLRDPACGFEIIVWFVPSLAP